MSVSNPSSTPSEDKTAALQDILKSLINFYHGGYSNAIGERDLQTAEQAIRAWAIAQLPEKYTYKHNHNIQGGKDGKYLCLHCRKTADEIVGNDGMGECPHFRSFNQAIDTATTNLKGDAK